MTIIAVKDGIIAADAGIFADQMARGTRNKILRLPDGSLFAGSGSLPVILKVEEWLVRGCADPQPDKQPEEHFGGLLLKPDGSVWRVDHLMNIHPDCGDMHVEGSHNEFLIGALAMGATAEQAVRLGCERCMWAIGPVQVETVPGLARPGKGYDVPPKLCINGEIVL